MNHKGALRHADSPRHVTVLGSTRGGAAAWEVLYGRHAPVDPLQVAPWSRVHAPPPHCELLVHGFSHQQDPFATFTAQRPGGHNALPQL